MKERLIGREREQNLLNRYMRSGKSEFIALYGRRRVGKTFLIRKTIGKEACFTLTGMENADLQDQLANFHITLSRVFAAAQRPSSWIEAFYELEQYLEQAPQPVKIVVIDELPWLDTVRSKLIGALEHFWNAWASARSDIKLIVCGSATSWMINHIINNYGGLHNRVTHQMHISPFTLGESRTYFSEYGFGYREKEIAECHMILGGVPYYYSLMNPEESVAQNIDRLFFSAHGELHNEFNNLYRSLFKKESHHVTIVATLANKTKGLTRKEIIKHTGLNNNALFTKTLEELEECGFIRRYIPYGQTKRDILFQLTDAFTLFHFHYEADNKYQDEAFWSHSLNSPRYRAWSGYAFEMLCLNHIDAIKKALGILGIQSRVCSWTYRPVEGKGAQIDLLIDRADQTVNICEMKFSRSIYEIDKTDSADLENKMDTFLKQSKTKKSVMLTLITTYGIAPNRYSGQIQCQVTLSDLFG